MKLKVLTGLLAFAMLAGCGDKPQNAAQQPGNGGLANLKSPENVKKAAESTMPKGDPSKSASDYREITSGNNLMFLYHALSSLPIDYEKVTEIYSAEYRQTSDTFKRQDIVNAMKERINSQVAAAKNERYLVWTITSPYSSLLGSYEMQSKSFPIRGFNEGTFYYFSDNASQYHLSFSNNNDFKSLPVADESKARAIENLVSKNRGMVLKVYAFAQDADPSDTTVKAQIMKIKLTGINGEPIFE